MSNMRQQPYVPFELPAESSTVSLWKHTLAHEAALLPEMATSYPPLHDTLVVDVAVVGAGITGLTTAFLLQKAGYTVAVLDAHPIGYGVSGFNSGHLTSMLLDMDFRRVLANFGEEATRTVTLNLQKTLLFIEKTAQDYGISCEFKRLIGYLYAEHSEQLHDLCSLENAVARAGLKPSRTLRIPLPFPVEEALMIPDQARFHPLKYIQGLAKAFCQQGGSIYENSRVLDVKNGGTQAPHCLETEAAQVLADEVVIATHTPIGFRPAIQSRLEAVRSYVIGIRSQSPIEDALFWDLDHPYHYIREASDEKGRLLIIGGEDHRTGEKHEDAFQNLEHYARQRFSVDSVDYRWSAQFYNPVDGLPYIGKLSGTYIATGYSGEGLSFGTLAAQIITSQIQGQQHPCSDILSPLRAKPVASAGGMLADNVNVLTHFVKDRLNKAEVTVMEALPTQQDIPVGEGRICETDHGKVAVYHSPEGVMHFLSPVCTHMKCIVGWNSAEKSWDCPCHGGRYDATGKVLNGPPVNDLPPIDL